MLKRIMGKSVNSVEADTAPPKSKSKSKGKEVAAHSAETLLPPRPEAPRSKPRASALQSQRHQALQAGGSQSNPWATLPTDLLPMIAGELSVKDRVALASTTHQAKDLLQTVVSRDKKFNLTLKAMNGTFATSDVNVTISAMRMLKEGRYPDDRAVLTQSLLRTVTHQLSHFRIQVRSDDEIKAVFKLSVELLKELGDQTQRLELAESISKKLPILAGFQNSSIFKNVPHQLRQLIAHVDQTRLTSTAARHLAGAQAALNQHALVYGTA